MNVIILGAGLVGWQLARQLVSEGKEITLIDRDPEMVRRAAERLDCRVLEGEGNSLPTLRAANIGQADFFISVTDSDEINMISCGLVAAEYPDLVTVARVRNVGYSATRMVRHQLYGIDHIINPEIESARAVIRSLEKGAVGTVTSFIESDLSMTSVTVESPSALIDRTVKDIHSSISIDFLLPLILRDGESLVPKGDTTILDNDMLYIIADSDNTDAFLTAAGLRHRRLRKIAIAGGGRIARNVADYIIGDVETSGMRMGWFPRLMGRIRNTARGNRSIHFIERDYVVARDLASQYPDAMVTNADISDEEVSETGLLEGYDLLLCATGNQELNLVSALFAKKQGISKTIALVRKASYIAMAKSMGVDVTVSITNTMVDSILSILRRGNIRGVHSIGGSDFEIIDFLLDKTSPIQGMALKDMKLPKDSLILLVQRSTEYLIPKGDMVLNSGDRVVVLTPRDATKKIEEVVGGV